MTSAGDRRPGAGGGREAGGGRAGGGRRNSRPTSARLHEYTIRMKSARSACVRRPRAPLGALPARHAPFGRPQVERRTLLRQPGATRATPPGSSNRR